MSADSGMSGYDSYSSDAGNMVAGTDISSVEGDAVEQPCEFLPPAFFTDHFTSHGVEQELPPSTETDHLPSDPQRDDFIWFPIHTGFQSDTDLQMLFRDEFELAAATMTRDLQVVTAAHIKNMASVCANFSSMKLLSSPFNTILPSTSVCDGMLEVTNRLIATQSALKSIVEGTEPIETFTDGLEEAQPSLFSIWPSNKSGLYLTKFISRYAGMLPCVPQTHIEISDYCLAPHTILNQRETVFQERGGILVLRHQMRTLDNSIRVDSVVINAWARVLMDSWNKLQVVDRTCLQLVERENLLSESQLVDQWFQWLNVGDNGPPTMPEMVFIPMYRMNHYTLLVISFLDKKLILIDTFFRRENFIWEDFEVSAIHSVFKLIERLGINDKPRLQEFEFEVMNPSWFGFLTETDTGISVMHMMEIYRKHEESSPRICLKEEHVRLRLRIELCSNIVMSNANLWKWTLVSSAKKLFEEKRNRKKYPFNV